MPRCILWWLGAGRGAGDLTLFSCHQYSNQYMKARDEFPFQLKY